MSRSGYVDDYDDDNQGGLYRASVDRAINGKRGQAFMKELATAMDAMDEKILIHGDLIDNEGNCCAIGVVCKARGIDVSKVDPHEPTEVGAAVNIATSMAAEIEFENDQDFWRNEETRAVRWTRMRRWVSKHIKEPNR